MTFKDRHHRGALWLRLIGVLLPLVAAVSTTAQEGRNNLVHSFGHRHQFGARLGVWANGGETPIPFDSTLQPSYDTDFSNSSFYLEVFFAYRIATSFRLESSVGIVNRGDVTQTDATRQNSLIGTLNIYPILVKAKMYPLAGSSSRLQPYLFAGGGLYYARQSIQFADFAISNVSGFEASETDFNYVLGGGLDYPISSMFSLTLNGQYMPIKFNDELITIRDYQATVITIGLTYLLPLSGKQNDE